MIEKAKSIFRLIAGSAKTFWWVIVLVLIVLVIGWLYLVKNRGKSLNASDLGDTKLTVMDQVIDKVKIASADVRVEHAILSTKAEEERKDLEEIRSIKDGQERRKRLAEKLGKSL